MPIPYLRGAVCALLAGTLAGCAWRAAEVPAFCYQWLAGVQCYLEPIPDAEGRLIGGHFVDAGDLAGRTYWRELARARMSR